MAVIRAAGLGLVALLVLAGCSGTDDAEGTVGTVDAVGTVGTATAADGTVAECVRASECTSLEPTDFAELAATDGVVLLDVRTPQEFAEGHLDGAVNLDVSAADFADRVGALDPNGVYAVYCRSGNRSQTAMELMARAGIETTADLAGGIGAWVRAGLPVATG